MFVHKIDPVLFELGPLEVRYYGLTYVIGFLLILFFVRWWITKRPIQNLGKDDVTDLMLYMMIGGIVGARAFHVFVYNFGYYMSNPAHMIMFWKGGMAFHGGLLGAILVAYFYIKRRKISFYETADVVVVPLAFALAIGRIANFINAELVGTVTSLPWCVVFPGYDGCRHPVQIYEMFKNIFIGSVLFYLLWRGRIFGRKLARGTIFWSFVLLYGILRFLAQFYRAYEIQLGLFDVPQYFSIAMILAAVFMIYWLNRFN